MKTLKKILLLPILGLLVTSCIVTGELGDEGSSGSSSTADTTAPNAATVLGWVEPGTHDSETINASWTISTSLDLKTQTITLYNDGTCTGAVIATDATIDHTTSTKTFTNADGIADSTGLIFYSYNVRSFDENGNNSLVGCSTGITIDGTFVPKATGLNWLEGFQTATIANNNITTATAQWTISTAADLGSQTIQLYTDNTCAITTGAPILLGIGINSYVFTLADNDQVYFDITSTDTDGPTNSSTSSCSVLKMIIDTTDPTNATVVTWTGGTPSNSTNISASWTPGTDGGSGLDKQEIQLWDGAACAGISLLAYTDVGGIAINSYNFSAADGIADTKTYSYQIRTTDAAGGTNETCSSDVVIDTAVPLKPLSLGWSATSPHNTFVTAADAIWTVSGSGDIATQEIKYYADGTCVTPKLPDVWNALGSIATANDTLAGEADGSTYSFKIKGGGGKLHRIRLLIVTPG